MTIKQWQRRPSMFARQALAVYAALVVYGSLYPFSGWRSLGLGPFAFLTDPIPQYRDGVRRRHERARLYAARRADRARAVSALARRARGGGGVYRRRAAVGRDGIDPDLSADARRVEPRSRRERARRADRRRAGRARHEHAARSRPVAAHPLHLVRARCRLRARPLRALAVRDDVPRAVPVRRRRPAARPVGRPRSVDAGRDPRLDARRVGHRQLDRRLRRAPSRRFLGSADHLVQPVRRARARDVAHARARAARPADARPARRDARREGGRFVPAIARGPDLRLGDRRRARRHRDRHAGRDALALAAARVARGLAGAALVVALVLATCCR